MSTTTDLSGHWSMVYSPDDEAKTGKGYYAELWWNDRQSPLFRTAAKAREWAEKHGGTSEHRSS